MVDPSVVSAPDTLTASLICMAVLSSDDISLATMILALSVPDTFNDSSICIAVESVVLMAPLAKFNPPM